jgi:tRNA (mo5U34)-methyltransferase
MDLLKESAEYYWYHCIDLGNGMVTDGDYDLRPSLKYYDFPDRMEGWNVLDVGRGSGFFAFEFEARGACVTATDIQSFLEWDFVGGETRKNELLNQIPDVKGFTRQHITGAFEFARTARKSTVESVLVSAYKMAPEAFGGKTFDLVFAGSITSHLRDPILAFEKIRKLTRRKCIVAAPSLGEGVAVDQPLMRLVGTMDSDRRSWWCLTGGCLVEMLRCAGFREAQVVHEFTLVNRRIPTLKIPHVVVHAYV